MSQLLSSLYYHLTFICLDQTFRLFFDILQHFFTFLPSFSQCFIFFPSHKELITQRQIISQTMLKCAKREFTVNSTCRQLPSSDFFLYSTSYLWPAEQSVTLRCNISKCAATLRWICECILLFHFFSLHSANGYFSVSAVSHTPLHTFPTEMWI